MTGTRANVAARAPRRWTPRALEARLVVPVAVGREGSKRSVVAGAGTMVVQRRRWIGMEQMMGAFKAVALKEPTGHRTLKSGWR